MTGFPLLIFAVPAGVIILLAFCFGQKTEKKVAVVVTLLALNFLIDFAVWWLHHRGSNPN
jgi:hypothetical protein